MIPVKTLPKFKCDFCKKRSTKSVIEKHERRCFRNPNRFCDFCENLGYTMIRENETDIKADCPYCAKFNKETLQAIIKYEEGQQTNQESSIEDLPF